MEPRKTSGLVCHLSCSICGATAGGRAMPPARHLSGYLAAGWMSQLMKTKGSLWVWVESFGLETYE